MPRGKPTKFAVRSVRREPVPKREQFLKNDWFFECERCGDPWPLRRIRTEPVTGMRVCPNDYDEPALVDLRAKQSVEHRFTRRRLVDDLRKMRSELQSIQFPW